MVKASDNEFPKVILKPLGLASAPADASWKLYPMADGVYARSSNSIVGPLGAAGSGGAVATDVIWDAAGDLAVGTGANTAAKLVLGAAGGAVSRVNGAVAWNSGTAFPTAATGDRYWRTDLGREAYYDGTRWLTTQVSTIQFSPTDGTLLPITADTAPMSRAATLAGTHAIYLMSWYQTWYIATTNSGASYWTFTLVEGDAGATIASFTTAAGAANTWAQTVTAINALAPSGKFGLGINMVKTGTPGSAYQVGTLMYRIVLT